MLNNKIDNHEEKCAQWLTASVSELCLSVRATNCLRVANIKTVGDLVAKEECELLGLNNFGRSTLKEIKKKLNQWGLSLKNTGGSNV
jgi:DNA-directed RNA polymerase subunit alpha